MLITVFQWPRSRSLDSWWKQSNTVVTVLPAPKLTRTRACRRWPPQCQCLTSTTYTGILWSTWPRSRYRTPRLTTLCCTSTQSLPSNKTWPPGWPSRACPERTIRAPSTGSGTTAGTRAIIPRKPRRPRRRSRTTDRISGTR